MGIDATPKGKKALSFFWIRKGLLLHHCGLPTRRPNGMSAWPLLVYLFMYYFTIFLDEHHDKKFTIDEVSLISNLSKRPWRLALPSLHGLINFDWWFLMCHLWMLMSFLDHGYNRCKQFLSVFIDHFGRCIYPCRQARALLWR